MTFCFRKYACVFQNKIFEIIILDDALDKLLTNSKLVLKCKALLNVLGAHNKFELLGVTGHCGVERNERTDFLTLNGSYSERIGPKPPLGVIKSCVTPRLLYNISIRHLRRRIDLAVVGRLKN